MNTQHHTPLRLGIAGLGTVGAATILRLQQQAALLAARAGRAIEVTAISARNPEKQRPFDMDGLAFMPNPLALATSSHVDCVVELIGGEEGTARKLVQAALENGKPVVTANKALIAHHGLELAELAEEQGITLAFEAAVAGGIPVVKTLREGLASNKFTAVRGILNGTCNYMLSEMGASKREFEDILKEAQDKGYAEADPGFDVDGVDAAHKLAILSAIAFGHAPHMHSVQTEGIRDITPTDMQFAQALGYSIKLLGSAHQTPSGIMQRVCPYLVPVESSLGQVHGVTNGVSMQADLIGELFMQGPGAGGDATASSVIADIMDIARGVTYFPFGIPTKELTRDAPPKNDQSQMQYYIRTATNDQPGALADITRVCHGNNISVDIAQQPRHIAGEPSPLILTTHATTDHAIRAACASISVLPTVVTEPLAIRILP